MDTLLCSRCYRKYDPQLWTSTPNKDRMKTCDPCRQKRMVKRTGKPEEALLEQAQRWTERRNIDELELEEEQTRSGLTRDGHGSTAQAQPLPQQRQNALASELGIQQVDGKVNKEGDDNKEGDSDEEKLEENMDLGELERGIDLEELEEDIDPEDLEENMDLEELERGIDSEELEEDIDSDDRDPPSDSSIHITRPRDSQDSQDNSP